MRKTSILQAIILIAFLTSSCVHEFSWTGAEEGSGKIVKEKRELAEFSKIVLKGSANVEINQGDKFSAELEIDDNLLEFIEFEIDETTLIISSKSNISPSVYNIILTMPHVEALGINGSGNIKCNMLAESDLIRLRINGSGSIELEAKSDKIKSNINGSGDIKLAGQSLNLNSTINGSGDINAIGLKTENVNISIRGSGDVSVYASERLDIEIFGSGDVEYKGNAKVKQTIYGSGSVDYITENKK
jgi:Putative auto-transporter adhesin, head GIN domain